MMICQDHLRMSGHGRGDESRATLAIQPALRSGIDICPQLPALGGRTCTPFKMRNIQYSL